jgi:4-amino-4-deoxy-L-arabinose transferase-like glycosyltransferase
LSNFWNNKKAVVLIAILLLGFLFRVGGVIHGLPFSYYPDEEHFMNRAMSIGTGDFNPHWFHKPALYMYVLFFQYGLFYTFGKLIGLFSSLESFARLYMNDKTIFLLIGRLTTMLIGIGMIYLIHRIGRRMFSSAVGLMAALILASNFSHVRSCQEIKADVPAAFFALLSFVFIVRILEKGLARDYILAGLFMGLGTATKYAPIALLIPAFAAHAMFLSSHRPVAWRKVFLGGFWLTFFFAFVGFFIGSPYNFLDPFWIRANILPSLMRKTMAGGAAADFSLIRLLQPLWNPLVHNGGVLVSAQSQGILVGALALMALPFLFLRGGKEGRLIAITSLSFIYISDIWLRSYAEARHLNTIYPFLSLGAAVLVYRLVALLLARRARVGRMTCDSLAFIVTVLLLLPSMVRIIRHDYTITRTDSRTMAYEWIEENIPAGTMILVDHYCVPLKMSPRRAAAFHRKAAALEEKGPFTAHAAVYYSYYSKTIEEPTYEVHEISHPWWKEEEEYPGTFLLSSEFDRDFGNPLKEWGVSSLEEYRTQGYRYLVTMEFLINLYLQGPCGESFPSFTRFYRQVRAEASLVRQFEPYSPQGPGPRIFIYEL